MTERAHNDDEKQFSVIQFFRYVSEGVEKINVPPITSANLVINKDAYEELGGEFDEGEMPFGHIGRDFPESNTDLVFIVDFYATGMAVCVGSFEYTFCHYEHLGDDEKVVARKVVDMLVALANGQVSLLCTYTEDDEKLQAIEVLYRKPEVQKYAAVATYPMFDSKRKLRNRELKTEHFANGSDITEIQLDDELLFYFLPQPFGSKKHNRKQITGLHKPLTREVWEKKVDDYYEKKSHEVLSKFTLRHLMKRLSRGRNKVL